MTPAPAVCGTGSPAWLRWLAVAWVLALAIFGGPASDARDAIDLPEVRLTDLPPEARATVALIRAGGPFPYTRDGSVFSNREQRLPGRPRGFYREYTVPTPGSRDRGARRIVAGGRTLLYWTGDHYASFQRITEVP
ncbi:MAG: ribonuclease domain-containing protein [Betaproteobacteria bacterium]|jgi:ribonuclease T1